MWLKDNMSTIKLNISLEKTIAETMRKRAAELHKPASRYLADLIEEDIKRSREELADEGYRLLSEDTKQFAERAWPIANETWPEWNVEQKSDMKANKQNG